MVRLTFWYLFSVSCVRLDRDAPPGGKPFLDWKGSTAAVHSVLCEQVLESTVVHRECVAEGSDAQPGSSSLLHSFERVTERH